MTSDTVRVPREPTPDMCFAGGQVNMNGVRAKLAAPDVLSGEVCVGMENAKAIWRAMLAAAPGSEAEKDAEDAKRYRELRNNPCLPFGVFKYGTDPQEYYGGDSLDAAIDAKLRGGES